MPYRGFESLDVWKRATELATAVYAEFGASRDWGLKDQVTRSAVSIASNVAEVNRPDFSGELRF